jgi:hypothetical protein
MPAQPGFTVPPEMLADEKEHRRQIARSLATAISGKLNATGSVTLAPSAVTTTLTDARIGVTSFIDFSPTTANANTAKSGLYVSARGKGVATLTHASNAAVDQTFSYLVIG